MILLISRLTDTTIIKIIEWLLVQNKCFHRINNIMEVLSSLYYDLSEGKYTYTAKTEDMVHSTEVQSYFFHGGGESAKIPPFAVVSRRSFGVVSRLRRSGLHSPNEKGALTP